MLILRRCSAHGDRLPVLRSSAGVLVGWAGAQALKRLGYRTRPCHGCAEIALVDCPDGSSFPSDQAASAFAGAAAVAAALPHLRGRLYAAATATALSRVYCGVHFPSDVAAGALLGHVLGRLAVRGR